VLKTFVSRLVIGLQTLANMNTTRTHPIRNI